MRSPHRIPGMLKTLEDIWKRYPDMRLGQLIDNARVVSGFGGDTFNIEDDDLETGLKRFADYMERFKT